MRSWGCFLAVLLSAAVGHAQVAAAPAPKPSPPPIPEKGALFGDFAQDRDIPAMETMIHRTLAINHHYIHWNLDYSKDDQVQDDIKHARIPLVSLNGVGAEGVAAAIARGEQDKMFQQQAAAIAKLGAPIFVRFGFEQNHDVRQFTPADYVAAWKRVYGIYRAQGATNVAFVWSPSAQAFDPGDRGKANRDPLPFYPGDQYVDWIGADGYAKKSDGFSSFRKIFTDSYNFSVKHDKPMMISEFGVDHGDGQAAWLRDAADSIKKLPQIKAVVYWDGKGATGMNYLIDSPAFTAAFRDMANDPYFAVGTGMGKK